MLNFTSALYLGMRHPSNVLHQWSKFTTGVPAVLDSPPGARSVARKLAVLQGCERSVIAPSTLHIFWDLFEIFSRRKKPIIIYMDAAAYPILRWGVERAASLKILVRRFPHHKPSALKNMLKRDVHFNRRPLVVSDGFCPDCNKPAPVSEYWKLARSFGGQLILDDTQAFGILGHSPDRDMPFGKGGGGTLRWNNIKGSEVLVVNSLAKAFGVPMASLGGSNAMVRSFEMKSKTRTYCSPPSIPAICAAEHALRMNEKHGNALRQHLLKLVKHFRKRIARIGFPTIDGNFPVQTLLPLPHLNAKTIHNSLLKLGIRTILRRSHLIDKPCISFIITSLHKHSNIDRTIDVLKFLLSKSTSKYY